MNASERLFHYILLYLTKIHFGVHLSVKPGLEILPKGCNPSSYIALQVHSQR